jgi:cell division protein FtsQ
LSTVTPVDGVDEAAIDPKIQARREQVQYERHRQRGRRLLVISIAAAVVAAGFWTFRSPLFDVDQIAVNGADRSGADAVREATGIDHGDRLMTVPLDRIADRVQAMPWVESATVSRSWPGTVTVSVVERTPVAAAPIDFLVWLLIDERGRQLGMAPDAAGLAILDDIPFAPEPGGVVPADYRGVIDVAASMPPRLRPMVVAVRPVEGGEVDATLQLDGGREATVRFGRPDQLERKWLSVLSILENADLDGISQIDVRVPAVPALTFS